MTRMLMLLIVSALIAVPVAADGYAQAVTVWAVVFNIPDACSEGVCDEPDVFDDPETPATSVVFVAGGRTDAEGHASFAAGYPEGVELNALPFPGGGLWDTDVAEIHLILRTHSRFRYWAGDQQITSFGGGCRIDFCEDVQFAVFKPEDADMNGHQTSPVFAFSSGEEVEGAHATLYREANGIRFAIHSQLEEPAE